MSNRFVVGTHDPKDAFVRYVPRPTDYVAIAARAAKVAVGVLFLMVVAPTVAWSQSVTTECSTSRHGNRTACTTRFNDGKPGAPIVYSAEEQAAIDKRDNAWAAYCKPTQAVSDDGLTRTTYAHKDCDIGVVK